MYEYRAKIISVYDGDTVTADIDLGFGVWLAGQKLRLYGINAPEIRGTDKPLGIASRDALRDLVLDADVTIHTYKDAKGKYGRWLARIMLTLGNDTIVDVNDWLVASGFAKVAEY